MRGLFKIVVIDGMSMVESSGFSFETVEYFDDLIENGNVFSIVPNADSITEIRALPVYILI